MDVVLHVSSDARDTDFTVKLIDVDADGRAYSLDDAILRARYRDGFDRQVWMEDGEVYEVRVGPLSTANVFAKGHRVRIEVSSSNFPRYDRNLNTGGNNWDETEGVVAHNAVRHSAQYPSRVVLPVVDDWLLGLHLGTGGRVVDRILIRTSTFAGPAPEDAENRGCHLESQTEVRVLERFVVSRSIDGGRWLARRGLLST